MSAVAPPADRPVCSRCGGTEISVDAAARWDEEKGDWIISGVFDDGHCDDCEHECEINWVAIAPPAVPALRRQPIAEHPSQCVAPHAGAVVSI